MPSGPTSTVGDVVRGLTTSVRLGLAAALCVLPLGLVWSTTAGLLTPGIILSGNCGYVDYEYCTPDQYLPGSYIPGDHLLGADVSARLFLVFAAVALGYAAVRTRTAATKRLVRAATVATGIALALATAQRAMLSVVCLVGALALVVPLAWRSPRKPGIFVAGHANR